MLRQFERSAGQMSETQAFAGKADAALREACPGRDAELDIHGAIWSGRRKRRARPPAG